MNTAVVDTYHTESIFRYMPQYIILFTNLLITAHTDIFLSFQDSAILRNSYIEFIIKISSVFHILIYVLHHTLQN